MKFQLEAPPYEVKPRGPGATAGEKPHQFQELIDFLQEYPGQWVSVVRSSHQEKELWSVREILYGWFKVRNRKLRTSYRAKHRKLFLLLEPMR